MFAGLYGVHAPAAEWRGRVKAFIINRFRGDPPYLVRASRSWRSSPAFLAPAFCRYTGCGRPPRDSLDLGRDRGAVDDMADVKQAWMRSLDQLHEASLEHLDYSLIERIAREGR